MKEYIAVTKQGYEVEVKSNTQVGNRIWVEFLDGGTWDTIESIRVIDHSRRLVRDEND